jgi:hypothetical protein
MASTCAIVGLWPSQDEEFGSFLLQSWGDVESPDAADDIAEGLDHDPEDIDPSW